MITINRKDTYDIKLSKRRLHGAGRCAARARREKEWKPLPARAGPEAGGGEQSTGGEGLSSGSGEQVAERLDRPARSADRAAAGPRRGHGDTERRHARDHRHAQRRVRHGLQEAKLGVFSKTFRRITNRGLRAPSPHTIFGNTRATPSGGHGTWPVNLGSVKVGEGPAARLSVNVAPGQFRMILTRKHSSSQARKQLGLKRAEGHRRKRASAQARVRKLPDHGPWNKYHGSGLVGLD